MMSDSLTVLHGALEVVGKDGARFAPCPVPGLWPEGPTEVNSATTPATGCGRSTQTAPRRGIYLGQRCQPDLLHPAHLLLAATHPNVLISFLYP